MGLGIKTVDDKETIFGAAAQRGRDDWLGRRSQPGVLESATKSRARLHTGFDKSLSSNGASRSIRRNVVPRAGASAACQNDSGRAPSQKLGISGEACYGAQPRFYRRAVDGCYIPGSLGCYGSGGRSEERRVGK